jgi:solute carrier family 25 S-adenosylmethionine transporter 26
MSEEKTGVPFTLALLSGGCAGTTVDVALFPLDTIKTRLQSSQGFLKAGGFTGVYNGVVATSLGSFPGAALFFAAYEAGKPVLRKLYGGSEHWTQHSLSASIGEVAACLVRVPTQVVTQRMQVGQYGSFTEAVRMIAASEGGHATFYSGFWTTVAREIPFSFIQFPIYERLKKEWAAAQGRETSPMQARPGAGRGDRTRARPREPAHRAFASRRAPCAARRPAPLRAR